MEPKSPFKCVSSGRARPPLTAEWAACPLRLEPGRPHRGNRQASGSGEPGTAGGLPRGEFIDSFLHSASQSFAQECVLGAEDTAVSRKDKVPTLLETDNQGK